MELFEALVPTLLLPGRGQLQPGGRVPAHPPALGLPHLPRHAAPRPQPRPRPRLLPRSQTVPQCPGLRLPATVAMLRCPAENI